MISQVDRRGKSALIWAAASGDSGTIDLLLRYGADPFVVDREGETALHLAARAGCRQCIATLISCGIDVSHRDNWGRTALETLVEVFDDVELAELIVKNGGDVKNRQPRGTPLWTFAAQYNHHRILRWLLDCFDTDINATNSWGATALAFALEPTCYDALRVLLERGARKAFIGGLRRTTLAEAAICSDIKTLEILK